MGKDSYYFSHDSNARNDIKIIRLRRALGMEGYGIYFSLIEILREQESFKLPIESLTDIAFELHTSDEKVRAVVLSYDLFAIEDERFFSARLLRSMDRFQEKKAKLSAAGKAGVLAKWGEIENPELTASQRRSLRMTEAKLKGTHTEDEWLEMCNFFDYKCVKCDCEVIGGVPTKDHIVAISLGGSDSIINLQPLCRQCNAGKTKDVVDYRVIRCLSNGKQMLSKWEALKKRKENKSKEDIEYYRIIKHLKLLPEEFDRLIDMGYKKEQIDGILDRIENYKKNTSYVSLFLTSKNWLKKEYPESEQIDQTDFLSQL